MSPKTIKECLLEAKKALKQSGAGEYALDSELFMMKAANITRTQVFSHDDRVLRGSEIKSFEEMVERRKKGEPTQYILGKAQFMEWDFYVDKSVLIPRADTEILVETVLEYNNKYGFKTMLDIGTGSGCIAVSLAENGIEMTASDISKDALTVAKKNAVTNKTDIKFVESDIFSAFEGAKFDAIVSNPPYIENAEINGLMREVRQFEPLNALDGGQDGLYFYKSIIKDGAKYLNEGGYIFFEIGYNQSRAVENIFAENGFRDIKTIKDLAGLDRVVLGKI